MTAESVNIVPGEGLQGGRLLRFNTLTSTNQWAIENIKSLGHGDIVWTRDQTAGRGRFDRKWISREGCSLTISVILQPGSSHDILISSISQIAALSIASTLEQFSIPAMVKWPNDVMAGGRKISGILTERDDETGKLVVGIGLNINLTAKDFKQADLTGPATSMKLEGSRDYDLREILNALLTELDKFIRLLTDPDPAFPRAPWQKRDFLKGRHINIHTAETMIAGMYSGIDDSGRLCLTDDAGKHHVFWSGDVSLGSGNYTVC